MFVGVLWRAGCGHKGICCFCINLRHDSTHAPGSLLFFLDAVPTFFWSASIVDTPKPMCLAWCSSSGLWQRLRHRLPQRWSPWACFRGPLSGFWVGLRPPQMLASVGSLVWRAVSLSWRSVVAGGGFPVSLPWQEAPFLLAVAKALSVS